MKKIILSFLLLSAHAVFAQRTEIYAGVNAGMLGYRGKSAVTTSFIVVSGNPAISSYTNDQYGRTAKGAAELSFTFQRVTKAGIIWGAAAGGEVLKNKVQINGLFSMTTGMTPAEGSSVFTTTSLNVIPLAGYRFNVSKKIKIDLTAGVDFAFRVGNTHEKGFALATGSNTPVNTDLDRYQRSKDVRLGFQTRIAYKRLSLIGGYWIGQSNYYEGYIGGGFPKAYSRVLRVGAHYRLTNKR